MKILQLKRFYSEEVTLGALNTEIDLFFTLEPPWKDNREDISCIPPGVYQYQLNENNIFVCGTPFWGEMGTGPVSKYSYNVQGFYFLNKSKNNKTKSVSKEKELQMFLKCTCLYGNNIQYMQHVLDICIKMVKIVPGYILNFEKNNNFLNLVIKKNYD